VVRWRVIRRSRAADWVVKGSLAAIAVCASQFPLLASQMPSAQNAPPLDEDPRTIIRSLTGHAGAVLGDSLIVAGGIWGRDHASLTNALSFRLPGNWSAGARTLGARDFPGMASLRGRIYLVGGMSRREIWMGSVLSWDGRSEAWRTHTQLPTPRNRLACVGAGEFLYAIGGMDRHGTSAACERFDPAADRWTTLAPMPTARHAHVAIAVGERIVVLGGETNAAIAGPVEVFDTITNRWESWPPMPSKRSFFGAVCDGDSIYVFGGRSVKAADSWKLDLKSHAWSTTSWPPALERDRFASGVLRGERGRHQLVLLGGETRQGGPVNPAVALIPFQR
jgi:hypothetical protein